jgi:hypothetical protein
MSLPLAPVDIVNLALDHLSQPPITSIDAPTTPEEEICARWYDQVRQMLLREYVWNFAKKRATITRAGDPEFDFDDKYTLPNDCLRVLSIQGDIEVAQEQDYDIEGRYILLNNGGGSSITLRYISDVTDIQQWDVLFKNIVVLTLALRLAYKFTLKKGVVEQINALLKLDLAKAVSVDGQERPPRRIQRSKYLNARRSGVSSNVADRYTVLD